MKTINRDKIQRMVGQTKGGSGGRSLSIGGGEGYATQMWIEENYISKEFFNRLFTIHGVDENDEPIMIEPNDTDTTPDSIEALFGLWTEQYVSALGQGSGGSGGGGGGALYLLADVVPNDSTDPTMVYGLTGVPTEDDGKVLTFSEQFGHWIAAEVGGGTISEITMTTPEFSGLLVNGGIEAQITSNGTFAITFETGYGLLSRNDRDILENLTWMTWWGQQFDTNVTGAMTMVPSIDNMLFFNMDAHDNYSNIQIVTGDHCEFQFFDTQGTGNTYQTKLRIKNYGEARDTYPFVAGQNTLFINYDAVTNSLKDLELDGYTQIRFTTAGTLAMTLDYDKLGIGTSSPAYTLDVSGYTKTNRLYLTDNVYLEYDSQNSGVHLVGAGFYSDSFISALGVSSGGGGGVSLNEPLATINSAGLGSPTSGQQKLLLWNGQSWVYASPSSGGVGTVTRVNTGSGLTGGPITDSGTIAIDSTTMSKIENGASAFSQLSNYTTTANLKTFSIKGGSVSVLTYSPSGDNKTLTITTDNTLAVDTSTANTIKIKMPTISGAQGTYTKVTVDSNGRVTSGVLPSNMNLSMYGITVSDPLWSSVNVGSATKLNTSRKLWGRSFNGTADVVGTLENVTHIRLQQLNPNAGGSLKFYFGGASSQTSYIAESSSGVLNINGQIYVKNGGNVGIGTAVDSSYKLKVSGIIYASTGIYSGGYITALATSSSSDLRMKNVVEDVWLKTAEIADAPMVKFTWKEGDDKALHVGSIAQYWQKVLPESVLEVDGMLSLQYGVLALLSAISLARTVVNHEQRLQRLEKELSN